MNSQKNLKQKNEIGKETIYYLFETDYYLSYLTGFTLGLTFATFLLLLLHILVDLFYEND
jgi:hypothetical protein